FLHLCVGFWAYSRSRLLCTMYPYRSLTRRRCVLTLFIIVGFCVPLPLRSLRFINDCSNESHRQQKRRNIHVQQQRRVGLGIISSELRAGKETRKHTTGCGMCPGLENWNRVPGGV
ncbi:unnamed protein product, partial [Ectocarpus fasciculatus]